MFAEYNSIAGIGGNTVQFDSKGDGLGNYDIFQYQQLDSGKYDYVLIGEWTDRSDFILVSKTRCIYYLTDCCVDFIATHEYHYEILYILFLQDSFNEISCRIVKHILFSYQKPIYTRAIYTKPIYTDI